MDGWMDDWMDERVEVRRGKHQKLATDLQRDKTHGQTIKWTNGRMNEWMDERINQLISWLIN